MKVATDRLVQGFVAAMGGDVETPQRRPDSMARHQEFEARLALVQYAATVATHRSSRRFTEAKASRLLDFYLAPTVTRSNGVQSHKLALPVSPSRDWMCVSQISSRERSELRL